MKIKQKIYLSIGLFLVIIIGLVFLVIKPIIGKINSKGIQIREQKILAQILQQEQINLQQLKNDFQNLEPKIPLLNQALLAPEKTLDFIKYLEEAAQKTSIQEDVVIMPAKEKNPAFRVNLQGSFANLIKFLAYLENGPYLVVIDSININKPEKEKEIKTALEFRVYTNEINQTVK